MLAHNTDSFRRKSESLAHTTKQSQYDLLGCDLSYYEASAMDTFLYHATTNTRRLKVNKFFNVRKPPWRNMLQSNNNCSLTLNLHQQ